MSIKRGFAIIAAFSACFCNVYAAQFADNYTSSDNKVFSTANVAYIVPYGGQLAMYYTNGLSVAFTDAGGVAQAKIAAQGKFVYSVPDNRFYSPAQAQTIVCNAASGNTTFYWVGPLSSSDLIDPGCVVFNSIKARSN